MPNQDRLFIEVIEDNLAAFGLEEDDFSIDESGAYHGLRVLRPSYLLGLQSRLEDADTQELVRDNVQVLRSHQDIYSEVELDLPFAVVLGTRESGNTLFGHGTNIINTAGKDTHPDGRSGLDYFWRLRQAFIARHQRIEQVTSGFKPGHENRQPARIHNRRLLLAFLVKAARDERSFRKMVRDELDDLGATTVAADAALFDVSVDALRSWKALFFAGVGYGQSAVREVLRSQHAAGQPFSLDAILPLDHAPDADADRLDRARGVALSARALESVIDFSELSG